MPRFFDDYSNTYLTHDSSAGRKQQRRGWKFRENFRIHYENYLNDWRRGPMGLASAQQAFVRARGKDDPLIPPLPDGWKEDVDDVTGISFYTNTGTGHRTWVRPGFIPSPPGAPLPPPGSHRGGAPPPMGMPSQPPPMMQQGGPPNYPPPPPPQRQMMQQPPFMQPPSSSYPPNPAYQPPFGGANTAGPPPPPHLMTGPPPPPPVVGGSPGGTPGIAPPPPPSLHLPPPPPPPPAHIPQQQ